MSPLCEVCDVTVLIQLVWFILNMSEQKKEGDKNKEPIQLN